MENPTLSVLMPTYERPEYIRAAIESALAQTFGDFVLLVGDNSESDRVEEVVRSFEDPRIQYHRNRPGLGAQGNWLDLVQRADSPLVATLHDDDIWEPEFLSSVVPIMLEDPTIAMVFTDYWIISSSGNVLDELSEREFNRTQRSNIPAGKIDYTLGEGLRLVAVWNAPQPAYAAVLRSADVKACEFPDSIAPLYDIWLSYQLVMQNKGFYYVPRRLTRYRVHDDSITSRSFSVSEDKVFGRILEENYDLPVSSEIAEYWAKLRWGRGTQLMGKPDSLRLSQSELRAAAPHLHGLRRLAAGIGSRSHMAWHALRLLKAARS